VSQNDGGFIMNGGTIDGNHTEVINGGTNNPSGGGVYMSGASTFVMTGGVISNNTGYQGGGVDVGAAAGSFTMNGGTITLNHATNAYYTAGSAERAGGVMNTGTFTMNGGAITYNDSLLIAGGISNSGTFTATNGVINSNTAGTYGGGIYTTQAITLSGDVIDGNKAAYGGGIYFYNTGNSTITDTHIDGNTAVYGGGIYLSNNSLLTVNGASTFVQNSATTTSNGYAGGGIYATPPSHVTVGPAVIFSRNYAHYIYNVPLGTDLPAYEASVDNPTLDPQYQYAWNNADISYTNGVAPAQTITYWRNLDDSDALNMIMGSEMNPGDPIVDIPSPWDNGDLFFAGWSLRPDDTCPDISDPAPTEYHADEFSADTPPNLNLYAIWCDTPPTDVTVSFDSAGGSPVPSQTIPSGGNATEPPPPYRSGCTFLGWYTNLSYDTRYNFAEPVYEDLTLVARWDCAAEPGADDHDEQGEYGDNPYNPAADLAQEEARLENILEALEAGDKCYNIGILTEYGYRLIEHNGTLYLYSELVEQSYLVIQPLTIAEVEADIKRLHEED
jgi:predicted outer membrane repeat protein